MAIEFKECSIDGYYHVMSGTLKLGQLCKYLSGEVLFNGIEVGELEQIVFKMKELQCEQK